MLKPKQLDTLIALVREERQSWSRDDDDTAARLRATHPKRPGVADGLKPRSSRMVS